MRAKSCHKSNHDYYFLCFPVKSFRTKHRISIELIRYSVILAYYMTQNIIVILSAQSPFCYVTCSHYLDMILPHLTLKS